MCIIGQVETTRLYSETYHTARKPHVCCECNSTIDKGDEYQKISGLWDGYFSTYKTCAFCADVRREALSTLDLNSDEGIPLGNLWECVGMDFAGI